MNQLKIVFLLALSFLNCENGSENIKMQYLTEDIPGNSPIEFRGASIPEDKLIHKGMFSPDLNEYYYTISNKNFEHFDVQVIRKEAGQWSKPQKAFFNSEYDEHGMSFSPSGNTLYFSSTRPVRKEGTLSTWHIWKSEKIDGQWQEPNYVDIPNLRSQLLSHPTITNSGTLYFHSSNPDYSEMEIYRSEQVNGQFQNAEKVKIPISHNVGKCTPFASPDEKYLVYATIGKELELMVSFNDGKGNWTESVRLNDEINHAGQGNPFITPDGKFLFYTTGGIEEKKWTVKWVNIESELTSIVNQ